MIINKEKIINITNSQQIILDIWKKSSSKYTILNQNKNGIIKAMLEFEIKNKSYLSEIILSIKGETILLKSY